MREIKFRAFNVNHQMMHYGVETQDLTYFLESKDFETMQYTGLTDRNGKEIYEGDIVRFLDAYMSGEDGDWDECVCTGQIKWDTELAQFYVTNRESIDNDDFWEQVDEAEVIGNIYENPELLGGADNE